jgi:hypothetical protein
MNAYMHTPDDTYNPIGVDGQSRNRLALWINEPSAHCKLKPLSWQAAFEATSETRHPSLWRQSWSSFGTCEGSTCDTCPLAKHMEQGDRNRLHEPGIIRIDDQGRPWLMNKQKRGWGEYGLWFKDWPTLMKFWDIQVTGTGTDEHGQYIKVK